MTHESDALNGHSYQDELGTLDIPIKLIDSVIPPKLWTPIDVETNLTVFQRLIEKKFNQCFGKINLNIFC
jgi:hypothetical protein